MVHADDVPYWLGLIAIPSVGPARLKQLIAFFGGPRQAWDANASHLKKAGLPERAIDQIITQRNKIRLTELVRRLEASQARLIALDDPEYPEALRTLNDAPPLLFMRGNLQPQDGMALAIVGTRKASRYGRDAAFHIARELARQGITIVSGMALGIDSAAHEGAIAGGGRTIAFMGNGIDRIYPRENIYLAQRIQENGAILTELALGTAPIAGNFPRRNRLISGLSSGVLVAEAPEHSGALITAEVALEQGRDVFAIPANIFSDTGRGTNKLIQDGAKLVMKVQDVLDELNIAQSRTTSKRIVHHIAPDSPEERQILECLEIDPIHVDDIIRITGLPTARVTAILTILELKGLAQTSGSMQYCRID